MLQSLVTGLLLAAATLSAGPSIGEAREPQALRGSEQSNAVHEKFAHAPAVSEPYQRLFAPDLLKHQAPRDRQARAPRSHSSKVTCGLTMMLVDPQVDDKMALADPAAAGQKPTVRNTPAPKVRRIEPTICHDR
jgi:hypothetical protein